MRVLRYSLVGAFAVAAGVLVGWLAGSAAVGVASVAALAIAGSMALLYSAPEGGAPLEDAGALRAQGAGELDEGESAGDGYPGRPGPDGADDP